VHSKQEASTQDFDDVREEIESYMLSNKQQQLFTKYLEELKAKADITIYGEEASQVQEISDGKEDTKVEGDEDEGI